MGKSKARILRKGINNQMPKISRSDAIKEVTEYLKLEDIKSAKRLITIFGLNAEEILEAGASYESVVLIKNIFG